MVAATTRRAPRRHGLVAARLGETTARLRGRNKLEHQRNPREGVSIASYSQEWISRHGSGTRGGQTPMQEWTPSSSLDLLLHVEVEGSSRSAWVMKERSTLVKDSREEGPKGCSLSDVC
ncbi:hypothetical protein NL676_030056 [Syzygium grande]|nr:hypothetical protein NL676_030056 [Syzygium grande]